MFNYLSKTFTLNLTKIFAYFISISMLISNTWGLNGKGEIALNMNRSLGCVDSLGRDVLSSTGSSEKQVGIFYFLWQGEHGTDGPYDNSKIVAENPQSVSSEANWISSGGGSVGAHHFWGEPLFGYYTSKDKWVLRKHLQMLTDAGVDFIVLDTTNTGIYEDRVKDLIGIWYEYLLDGWDVPQIAFYTNTSSGDTMNRIYDTFYNNKDLNKKYPRLHDLWYQWDGRPMIIGLPDDSVLRKDVKAYFRIKESQWPTEDRKADGFPWMEFNRSLTYKAVYGKGLKREIMSVSAAQHADSGRFSATAWYGANDRTRSWHNGANDNRPNSAVYGFNFAEQWDFALSFDPEVIFVTGFNEWVAQRQPSLAGEPVVFVDCADTNGSRDIEPMNGLLGDNYYMQLVNYIAKFKGNAVKNKVIGNVPIDINSGFEQWSNPNITSYKDYANDIVDRDCAGFGNLRYTDKSGRNDIRSVKFSKDDNYLYFYANTTNILTLPEDNKWMNLLLSVDNGNLKMNGYDYAVNIRRIGNKTAVEKYNGTKFVQIGIADIITDSNNIMIRIERNLLGLKDKKIDLQFKWADNCNIDDIYSFYTAGESAPYGRLNFTVSE